LVQLLSAILIGMTVLIQFDIIGFTDISR